MVIFYSSKKITFEVIYPINNRFAINVYDNNIISTSPKN